MGQKKKLAIEYLELRKEFDGDEFKPGLIINQIYYLVKKFNAKDLKIKINAVKFALAEKKLHLKKEAYYNTSEGKAYKSNIENEIDNCRKEYRELHDEFEDWIVKEINKMLPGDWGARLSFGYYCGNVEIGLINRDPDRNTKFEFGHDFTIYFDAYTGDKNSPEFKLNYGSLGSFDIFNDETRPVYLNGLATISNNKEWLQILMTKFIEYVQKTSEDLNYINELEAKIKNPFENK